jgi:Tol biopolymer transport system component
LFSVVLLAACCYGQRKPGDPLAVPQKNIEILTHFGERADISPDNQHIAFMDKSFGDAFTIDLKTRAIRCLTGNVPGTAFLRVMHVASGSHNIDIWKLKLDGTGQDFHRLTNFNDYEGYKASNPVVSTDGRFMAFQLAKTADEAGVGYGILLYHLR